jgi:hypothetical protein
LREPSGRQAPRAVNLATSAAVHCKRRRPVESTIVTPQGRLMGTDGDTTTHRKTPPPDRSSSSDHTRLREGYTHRSKCTWCTGCKRQARRKSEGYRGSQMPHTGTGFVHRRVTDTSVVTQEHPGGGLSRAVGAEPIVGTCAHGMYWPCPLTPLAVASNRKATIIAWPSAWRAQPRLLDGVPARCGQQQLRVSVSSRASDDSAMEIPCVRCRASAYRL